MKVLESASLIEAIDHVLFGHVKDQMDLRKLDSRLQMSVYYVNVNGGLKVQSAESKIDGFVKEKLIEALKALQPKLDS